MKISNKTYYTYDDVNLVPKLGIVASRNDVDLTTRISKNIEIEIPIVASPMRTVVNDVLATKLYKLGGYAFLHRFQSIGDQVEEYLKVKANNADCGCAFGIKDLEDRIPALIDAGCKSLILDTAHAHSIHVIDALKEVPDSIWKKADIIIGSICTSYAMHDFQWNFPDVAGFRVGVGSGSCCTTRIQTGFGLPQLSAIEECLSHEDIPIISDGGIRNSSDIVKSLAIGASSVMLGRLLAYSLESPHSHMPLNGSVSPPNKKIYHGEASNRAKQLSGLETAYIEGGEVELSHLTPLAEIIQNLTDGIRSGISYGGGSNIKELQENAEFILVTQNTKMENGIYGSTITSS